MGWQSEFLEQSCVTEEGFFKPLFRWQKTMYNWIPIETIWSAISSCKYKFSQIVRYLGNSPATLRNVGLSIKETWLSDCFGRLAVKTFIGHVSQNYIFSASLWILVFWLFLSQWFEFLAIVLLAVWLRWGEWLTLNFNNGHFVSWWGGNIHTGGRRGWL